MEDNYFHYFLKLFLLTRRLSLFLVKYCKNMSLWSSHNDGDLTADVVKSLTFLWSRRYYLPAGKTPEVILQLAK